MIQVQLIEGCPLNSSSSHFWQVRVAEVVDELMTGGVKSRHRANPCQVARDVLVGIQTAATLCINRSYQTSSIHVIEAPDQVTNCTKHINIAYHWIREAVDHLARLCAF